MAVSPVGTFILPDTITKTLFPIGGTEHRTPLNRVNLGVGMDVY